MIALIETITIYLQQASSSEILIVLVPLTALDYISGFIAAAINKELNSKIGTKGLLKKILIYLGIFSIAVVQQALPEVPWLLQVFVMFFILNETLSILENLTKAGIPLPTGVIALLTQKRDEANNKQE